MKNNFFVTMVSVLLISGMYGCGAKDKAPVKEKSQAEIVQAIIASMTLEQKVQLLIGTGMFMDLPDSLKQKFAAFADTIHLDDESYNQMVDKIRMYLPGAAGFSSEFSQLGITSQVLADGPAGLRISPKRKNSDQTYYCTAFPIATALASTWDTELIHNVGKAMGNEVLEYGADVLLAPGMNIQRDPLCGRNFEYYSEDPLITGKMAAAMVNGVQSNGVGTSIKHFAANNQETNRLSVNVKVSERALREIYLRGFEIAVTEAQPWTVMSSYNKINGLYTSENHDLLTKILRTDWGFKGYVMTDWGGGSNVVAQMKAGNDMIMPGTHKQILELISAVNEGKIDESVLDQNLTRILTIMLQTPKYKGYKNSNAPDLQAHATVARQVAAEGMILLENKENTLPIAADVKQLAVFGTTSYEFISGGTGSGDVNEAYTISLMDGLKNGGFAIDEELAKVYTDYIAQARAKMGAPKNWLAALLGGKEPVAEMKITAQLADKMADKSNIALITIGRNSGEALDRMAVEGDFYLNATEMALIKQVTKSFHAKGKKVIVVLNIGGVIETLTWKDLPDAVLCAWQPGQEAGNSVVDVLTGKVNPSGKLAVTFLAKYTDAPTAKNFPGTAVETETVDNAADLSGFSFMSRVPWEVNYEEDIFVGYRHYNTNNVAVAYEFGYGLSYTTFEYSNVKLNTNTFDKEITVTVDVKNTGTVAGREVVQVYLSSPMEKMAKPAMVLVDFGKTKLLKAGESQTLTFVIEAIDLCSFDTERSAWVADAGSYTLKVGSSSRKLNAEAAFSLASEQVVKTVSKLTFESSN